MAITTGAISSGGFGFAQGTTWGTAVACGSGRGLRLRSENITGGFASLPKDHISDAWGAPPDIGSESWSGTIASDAYYGGNVPEVWAYVFGTSGSPSGSTTYTHTTDLADSLGDFATFAIGKRASAKPWEFASMMARRLVIRGSGNGRVTWEMDWVGGPLSRSSSTNTTTTLAALTIPTLERAMLFTDGVFRINAQSGGSLGSSDVVSIAGFELVIERPLAVDFLTGASYVAQPSEDGPCSVTLAIDLRSYDADTYIDLWDGASTPTERKADLVFSSGVTPTGGSELKMTFSFPRMTLMESPQAPVSGTGRVPHRLLFKCVEASSAPTGMTGITKPVRLVNIDEDSSAYLA